MTASAGVPGGLDRRQRHLGRPITGAAGAAARWERSPWAAAARRAGGSSGSSRRCGHLGRAIVGRRELVGGTRRRRLREERLHMTQKCTSSGFSLPHASQTSISAPLRRPGTRRQYQAAIGTPKSMLDVPMSDASQFTGWDAGVLSREQVAQAAYEAGWRGDDLTKIVAIAYRESRWPLRRLRRPAVHRGLVVRLVGLNVGQARRLGSRRDLEVLLFEARLPAVARRSSRSGEEPQGGQGAVRPGRLAALGARTAGSPRRPAPT